MTGSSVSYSFIDRTLWISLVLSLAFRIIPIFLVHRPANNIPYATVEEELVGEFVKYSVRDGKEVNFLRRDSEAGQKCCTFQHWVYEKTNGSLLVTDLQGELCECMVQAGDLSQAMPVTAVCLCLFHAGIIYA